MWAAQIDRPGPAESIKNRRVPPPLPGPGDVLLRFVASAVNHVDTFVRSGSYRTDLNTPFTVGRDLVGQVVEDSNGFTAGQFAWTNSMGYAGRQGVVSELIAVPADRLYPLPDGVDPIRAAAVLHGAGTAAIGLLQVADLQPGQTLFLAGGAGAVGSAALQIAVSRRARVITTCSARDIEWCLEQGAASAYDYRDESVLDKLHDTVRQQINVWWDQSGGPNFTAALPLLTCGGTVLVTAGMDSAATLPIGPLYTRDLSILGFAISNANDRSLNQAAEIINRLLTDGTLQARSVTRVPWWKVGWAHAALEDGNTRGKIVLTL